MEYTSLSKEISYALRHAPEEYGLEPDGEGWVRIEQLILGLSQKEVYKNISKADIVKMIECSQKKRHEIAQEKIRALYGHSMESKIVKTAATPPAVLYHGTAKRFVSNIMAEGLLPQQRQYVHLSEDIETAVAVGTRHDAAPIVLEIDSARAHSDGVLFFHGGEKIWLTDFVLPCYLKKIKEL